MYTKEKSIYVVPTWHCNLHCPHCFVSNQSENSNFDLFLTKLKQLKQDYPNAAFILHGGEPTLFQDKYFEILNTGIITSMCSNLVVKTNIIDDLNTRNLSIATSWNPNRFSANPFIKVAWLGNIERLNTKPLILITLDQDLLKYDIKDFIELLHEFENRGIKEVLFEPLVDNSLDDNFQNKVDEWLCNTYDIWRKNNIKIRNKIEEQILHWDFRCDSLTLEPNGLIRKGCILGNECNKILDKCLTCNLAKICKPCVLHKRCSFYPKFYEKVKNAA